MDQVEYDPGGFSMKRHLTFAVVLLFLIVFSSSVVFSKSGSVYVIESRSFAEVTVNIAYTVMVERTLQEADNDPDCRAVIMIIDTPGGRVDAALKIKDSILSSKVPVYAMIDTHAISAGAIIALAADKIYIKPGGVIGDAAPVYAKGGEMKRAGEKAVSALRGVITSLAEKNNRPTRIAAAMVDDSIVLTRARDGITKPAGKLLTLTAKQAVRLKIADMSVKSVSEVLAANKLSGTTIKKRDFTGGDRVISFLTSSVMTTLLLTIGMMGMIFEVKTPGWGVGGTIGVLSLGLFFVSQILMRHSSWGTPVLFLVGTALLLIEIFIVPGFGLVGTAGIGAIVFSFLMAMGINNISYGLRILSLSLLFTALLTALLFKLIPRTRTFSKIVLSSDGQLYKSPTDHDRPEQIVDLIGMQGVSLSTLRPAGTVDLQGERYDAVSNGGFIESGKKITVVKIDGARLIVKETV